MSADRLFAHYERVADAPGAIACLRRFILDLAVRGKLVPQDPHEEPAGELLTRIKKMGSALIGAGNLPENSAHPAIAQAATPFSLPLSWRWVRLADIAEFSAGRTPLRNDSSFWNNGNYAWVSIADMRDGKLLLVTKETVSNKAKELVFGSEPETPGTIIMSFKLTIGKIARLGIPAFHNEAIISIRPHLAELDPYMFMTLPQFAKQGETKGAIKGATLNRESISNIFLPLPPLAEQGRIVARVNELMALCDQLEAARSEREAKRDLMAALIFSRINKSDPDTLLADTSFALNVLPALTARSDQIKALRQAILDLAVRGKLVAQNPTDEPASELLRRIKTENHQDEKKRKSRRQNTLPEIDTKQAPFPLPKGWTWARFPELGIFGRGKSKHRPRNDPTLFVDGTHPVIPEHVNDFETRRTKYLTNRG